MKGTAKNGSKDKKTGLSNILFIVFNFYQTRYNGGYPDIRYLMEYGTL